MTFSKNHLTQFYWVLFLFYLLYCFIAVATDLAWKISIFSMFVISIILAIRSITHKVIIQDRQISFKNIFHEKSITIMPDSRIYITRDTYSFNFIFRIYHFKIKVINSNQTLVINATVNNSDKLFEMVKNLENRIILPNLYKFFTENQYLEFDTNLSINNISLIYNNKNYYFETIQSIEIDHSHFKFLSNGLLWKKQIVAIRIPSIPNLTTFTTIVHRINNT